MSITPTVTVRGLLDARPESVGLTIELLAGARGLERHITSPYIQKTGLALAGFHQYLQPGRILLFGDSEVRFLESLDPAARHLALANSFAGHLPCLLVTGGAELPPEVAIEGERADVPILRTPVPTATAIGLLTSILEDRLAARMGACGPTNATPFAIAQNTTLHGGPKFLFFASKKLSRGIMLSSLRQRRWQQWFHLRTDQVCHLFQKRYHSQ